MKNIFGTYTFKWWQVSLLKLAVLFIGVAIGATWPELFAPYAMQLAVVGIVIGVYLGIVWLRS